MRRKRPAIWRNRSAEARHQESLAQIGKSTGHLLRQVHSALNTLATQTLSLQEKARPKLSKGEQETLARIVEEQAALEDMLQTCLDYMRPLRSDGDRVNVPNLVRWLVTTSRPQATEAAVSVSVELGEGLPTLGGNRPFLRRALLRVVGNAIEASRGSGGAVTIRARRTKKSVVIEVMDTGEGIPPDASKGMFEPSYCDGVALGLAFAKKVVEDHGGRIAAKCEPGVGTTVRISLPVTGTGRTQGAS